MSSGSGTDRLVRRGTEPDASSAGVPGDEGPDDARARRARNAGPSGGRRRVGGRVVLPDPPLVDPDAGIRLRPWTTSAADVDALAAAWSDPVLAAVNGVPANPSAEAAARWLAGDAQRLAAGRSLDLVVAPLEADGGATVLGEVGLRNIDRIRRRAEISWWVGPDHRGRGLATAATRLLAGWALSEAGGGLAQVWARIDPRNRASGRVAAAAGFVELGPADGTSVWARART